MVSEQVEKIEERMIGVDDAAHQLLEPYTETPPVQALDFLSKAGDQPELRFIASGLLVAGTFAGNNSLVRVGARMIIAHEAATLIKNVLKTRIDRTRPRSAIDRKQKKPRKGNHTAKEKTSFPSGHSAGSIAAACAFGREFPEYRMAALAGAGFIAAAQVVRGAHYPSDVAAGVLIGIAVEAASNAVWDAAKMDERSIA